VWVHCSIILGNMGEITVVNKRHLTEISNDPVASVSQ
jgi:hypothetical protein